MNTKLKEAIENAIETLQCGAEWAKSDLTIKSTRGNTELRNDALEYRQKVFNGAVDILKTALLAALRCPDPIPQEKRDVGHTSELETPIGKVVITLEITKPV